jgi:hypothetical protein
MVLCSFDEDNKSCGTKASRLEDTNTPLCSDHYQLFILELSMRAQSFYAIMGEAPYVIEIAPEVDWGRRWYLDPIALTRIKPAQEPTERFKSPPP